MLAGTLRLHSKLAVSCCVGIIFSHVKLLTFYNKPHSLEREIKSSEDGVQLPYLHGGVTKNGRTHNPLTLPTVPVLVHVWVWVYILGDPQNVQLRYAKVQVQVQQLTFVCFLMCFQVALCTVGPTTARKCTLEPGENKHTLHLQLHTDYIYNF